MKTMKTIKTDSTTQNSKKYSPVQVKYLLAKTAYENIKTLDIITKTKVLADNEFFIAPEWEEHDTEKRITERITDPKADYLMTDTDFDRYSRLCFAEYQRLGIAPKDHDTVVTYQAFEALKAAEKALINWGYSKIKTLPQFRAVKKDIDNLIDRVSWDIDTREKMIELTLRVI